MSPTSRFPIPFNWILTVVGFTIILYVSLGLMTNVDQPGIDWPMVRSNYVT